ncbi:MAG: hypothetical protein Q8N02_02000 [Methylotenera sp.]|nr:hypothetical protein [Methylotenera sp.]MDP3094338.1 hypothetical protein [Methylotenera sp.]MDP3207040.1 hypothetical protein [Methylotenera sp.]MDZ4222230.1 hypothetical protein [Methylotenera sp.]
MQPFIKASISSLLIIILTILAGCGKVADTKQLGTFCNNLQIGSDLDQMAASLSGLGLELRTRAPEADHAISNLLSDPYSVDGALVTFKGLHHTDVVPACMIYFSSILHRGDGKIIYKQFITKEPKGI